MIHELSVLRYQAINKVLLHVLKCWDKDRLLGDQLNLTEDIENVMSVGAYVNSRPFIIIILRASISAWLRLKSDLSSIHGISLLRFPTEENSWKILSHLWPWTICFPFTRCPLLVFYRLTVEFYPSSLSVPLSPTLHSSFLSVTIIDSLLFRHGRFQ